MTTPQRFLSTAAAAAPSGARRRLTSLIGAGLLLCSTVAMPAYAQSPQVLPTVKLGAGMHLITAMVAANDEQRAIGLMYRKDMAQNDGMVFLFKTPGVQCFWMKNTPIALSTAFLADDGTIVNIADMAPFDLNSHCSAAPVRYVLEMNQGWFAKRGIKAGQRITGLPTP